MNFSLSNSKFQIYGFTLVELLISITISAILFIGVLVFVSSNMWQNIKQEKILTELSAWNEFQKNSIDSLNTAKELASSWSSFWSYGSGIIIKKENGLPYIFLGLKYATGACDSFSGSQNASGTGYKLIVREYIPTTLSHLVSAWYSLSHTGNILYSGSTVIVGTGHPGNSLGLTAIETELNQPSALVRFWNYLYIADTLNHRILAYNISSKQISELLSAKNGILLPTDITLSGSSLLIANAGRGEILEYKDGEWVSSPLAITFIPNKTFDTDSLAIIYDETGIFSSGNISTSSFTNSWIAQVTASGLLQIFDSTSTVSSGSTHTLNLSNLTNTPTSTGSHTLTLHFYSGSTLRHSHTTPYFTKGDGRLDTTSGNVLKVIQSSIDFPHNLTSSSVYSSTITDWSSAINSSDTNEVLSPGFIDGFTWNKTGNILTLQWDKYNYYDCLGEKHKTSEQIMKFLLKK